MGGTSVGSKHGDDQALDFRTHHLTATQRTALVVVLQRRLGPAYDVLVEDVGGANEHGHAEWDPKTKRKTQKPRRKP